MKFENSLDISTCVLQYLFCSRTLNLSYELKYLHFTFIGFRCKFFSEESALNSQVWNDAQPLTKFLESEQKNRGKVTLNRGAIVCHPFPVERSRMFFQTKRKEEYLYYTLYAHTFTSFEHVSNANFGQTLFDYPRRAWEYYSLKRGKLTLIL